MPRKPRSAAYDPLAHELDDSFEDERSASTRPRTYAAGGITVVAGVALLTLAPRLAMSEESASEVDAPHATSLRPPPPPRPHPPPPPLPHPPPPPMLPPPTPLLLPSPPPPSPSPSPPPPPCADLHASEVCQALVLHAGHGNVEAPIESHCARSPRLASACRLTCGICMAPPASPLPTPPPPPSPPPSPPPLPPPAPPPQPAPPPAFPYALWNTPVGECGGGSAWCSTFDSWFADPHSKFYRLWGPPWHMTKVGEHECWNWRETSSAAQFFEEALAGERCDRDWVMCTIQHSTRVAVWDCGVRLR